MSLVSLRRCHPLLLTPPYRPSRAPRPSLGLPCVRQSIIIRSLSTQHTLHQHDSLLPSEDTIFALSSAPGRAAIAIIRISGPKCVEISNWTSAWLYTLLRHQHLFEIVIRQNTGNDGQRLWLGIGDRIDDPVIYHKICHSKPLPEPRYAAVRTLYAPPKKDAIANATREHNSRLSGTEVLDSEALVLYFPGPQTVTGEDILELHTHGGPATVKAVLGALPNCLPSKVLMQKGPDMPVERSVVRYAEAGEFTKRAFMNNRLDLTQVEALGDVLAANTEQQRKLSVRGTTGTLAKSYEVWRKQLLYARGELEALIDFSEDQHFDESPAVLAQSVARQVEVLVDSLEKHICNAVRGELLRNGISIALLGAPNAGKSSLLNRIVGREAAIVSKEAGTTRDVVEVGLDIGGYLCRVGDMAGLRGNNENTGEGQAGVIGIVEEEGIKRAKARALDSDLVICVFNVEKVAEVRPRIVRDEEVLRTAEQCLALGNQVVIVVNKCDLLGSESDSYPNSEAVNDLLETFRGNILERISIWYVSCKEDRGIKTMLQGLTDTFEYMTRALSPEGEEADASIWQESLGASERHKLLLQECLGHLNRFLNHVPATPSLTHVHMEAASRAEDMYVLSPENGGGVGKEVDVVLAAESLRAAADCLARITGRGGAGDVEEVLGVVFEKFCVGK